MIDRRMMLIGAVAVAFLVMAWLDFVIEHRRSRDETIARLIAHGVDRAKMLRGEGITDEGIARW